MKPRTRLGILLFILLIVAIYAVYRYWDGPPPPTHRIEVVEWPTDEALEFPEEVAGHFGLSNNEDSVYLVQEPADPDSAPAMLIYLHGAMSNEEQGMGLEYFSDSFKRLRAEMAERNWIYVTPRHNVFDELLAHLEERYGKKPIYLAGASAGGVAAYVEMTRHPDRYAGAILLCPALADRETRPYRRQVRPMELPFYIVSGEKDGMIAPACRALARALHREGKDFHFVEVIGGNHSAPPKNVDWEEALDFVAEMRQ